MKDQLLKEISQTLVHWGFNVGSTEDTDIFISETATAVGIGGALYDLEILIAIAIDFEDDAVLYYERLTERIASANHQHIDAHHMLKETNHFDDKVHHKIVRQVTHASGEITETTFDLSNLADTLRAIVKSHGLRFKVVLSLGKVHRYSHQQEPKDLEHLDHLDHPRHTPHHYVEPKVLEAPVKTYAPYYSEEHLIEPSPPQRASHKPKLLVFLTLLIIALCAAIFFFLL